LNCGACGYNSCREKAIAVYQGIAEVRCASLIYCLKKRVLSEAQRSFETVNNLNEQLNAIFESSYDGLHVCDAEGKIIKANSAWRNMVGIEEIPETAKELEDGRTVFSFRCAVGSEEKRRVTFLQECRNGRSLSQPEIRSTAIRMKWSGL